MGLRGSSLVTKFATTLFIARFLDLDALGIFGLVTAATITVPTILGLSLMHSLSRKAITQSASAVFDPLSHYLRYTILLYLIILGLGLVIMPPPSVLPLGILIGCLIFFEHLNLDFYTLFINQSRALLANILHALRTSGWMLAFMVCAFFFPSLRTIEFLLSFWLAGAGIAALFGLIALKVWRCRSGTSASFVAWLRSEIRSSHILYWNSLMFSGFLYIDRFIISLTLGLELTGVYVFFWQICSALLNLLSTGVIQMSRPALVSAFHSRESAYVQVYAACRRSTFAWSLFLSVTAGAALYVLLPYLQKPLIESWLPLMPILLIGFMFAAQHQVQDLVFYSQHRELTTLKLDMFLMPLMLLLYAALIPPFGLWGASACLLIFSVAKFFAQERLTQPLLRHAAKGAA